MKKKHIGLRTYLYIFKEYDKYKKTMDQLKNKGLITKVFLNNNYGFEIKLNKKIGG